MRKILLSAMLVLGALLPAGALGQFGVVTNGGMPPNGCVAPQFAADKVNNGMYYCKADGTWGFMPSGVVLTNATSTGTTLATLTKLTGTGTAVIAGTGDNKNGVIIGVALSGVGTSGNVGIMTSGVAPCVFDGATTANDFVTPSTTVAGNCHDTGSGTVPTDGSQIIGRVLSTNGSGGTYAIAIIMDGSGSSGVGNGLGVELFNTAQTAGTSSISATTMVTPTAAGNYRFSYYLSQTVLGTSCAANSTVQVAVKYQDQSAAAAQVVNLGLYTVTTNGTLGVVPWTSGPTTWTFRSVASVPIQFQTTYSPGGSCAPAPAVQLIPVLEAL